MPTKGNRLAEGIAVVPFSNNSFSQQRLSQWTLRFINQPSTYEMIFLIKRLRMIVISFKAIFVFLISS
jgi:hypothetical protein